MNYKNVYTGEVISSDCWAKLPDERRKQFLTTRESITHAVLKHNISSDEEENSFSTLTRLSTNLSSMLSSEPSSPSFNFDSTPSQDNSSSNDFGGFGSGDAGGGGSNGDW